METVNTAEGVAMTEMLDIASANGPDCSYHYLETIGTSSNDEKKPSLTPKLLRAMNENALMSLGMKGGVSGFETGRPRYVAWNDSQSADRVMVTC